MTQSPEILASLVDVIALSQTRCSKPIQAHLAYATPHNFVGRVIQGYTPGLTDFALMTQDAAEALCQVQNDLVKQHNLSILIYDSYRPKRAVLDFVVWSKQAISPDEQGQFELARKDIHYPRIEKSQLFELQYVAEDSQHCYGHTVDLVLLDANGQELDHGACFDHMDTLSHIDRTAEDIGEAALRHRSILEESMNKQGFIPYQFEYWHFSYCNKMITHPLDIAMTPDLKGLNTPRVKP